MAAQSMVLVAVDVCAMPGGDLRTMFPCGKGRDRYHRFPCML